MDTLKHFLDNVCKDSNYNYEKVDNIAEIYQINDATPIAQIEWHYSLGSYGVRFRIGISSLDIARLTNIMSVVNDNLLFDEDFIIDPDYGYLYGEEATQAFINRIQNNIQESQVANAMNQATYISDEPIFAYGSRYTGRTKIEKIWDADDYSL